MKQKPIILVAGAATAEGSSVARHLLESGQFAVRILAEAGAGKSTGPLQAAGAEVATGSLNDKRSIAVALQGCYGVYGLTSSWEHFIEEYEQGTNLVDAVVESGVPHFVFSTRPSVYAASQGRLSVPHFEVKARLEAYARTRKSDTTFVHPAFYYENFLGPFSPQKGADGTYFFGFPQGDAPLAAVSVNDIGGIVLPLFLHPQQYKGKIIEAVGDVLTGQEFAAVLSKISGKKIRYQNIPRNTFVRYAVPAAEELANMFEYYRLYQPQGAEALAESRRLYPSVKSFEQRLTEQKQALAVLL